MRNQLIATNIRIGFWLLTIAVIMISGTYSLRRLTSPALALAVSEEPSEVPRSAALNFSAAANPVSAAATPTEELDGDADEYTLTYQIDRTQVPPLYYQDLTLKVTVNQFSDATVTGNGTTIPYTYNADTGQLIVTTSAITVDIALSGVTDISGLGQVEKTALKEDKGFAWSHGMDDNINLKTQVDVLEEYGWRGTLFLIGDILEDDRNEEGIVDAPYLKEKLSIGWSIGNHTWDHTCDPTNITEQTVLDGYNRLRQIVDASPVPDYQVVSFAAPCFVSEYHPIILAHRDNHITDVQFNESGGTEPLVIDPGVTENITDPDNPGQILAAAFNYDMPIGRGLNIETGDLAQEMAMHDLMANLQNEQGLHLWHNTLAHGDTETGPESHAGRLATIAAYVESTYGTGGTNQVWVAPSDQIYSYLLVRDRSVVSLLSEVPASSYTLFLPTIQKP